MKFRKDPKGSYENKFPVFIARRKTHLLPPPDVELFFLIKAFTKLIVANVFCVFMHLISARREVCHGHRVEHAGM